MPGIMQMIHRQIGFALGLAMALGGPGLGFSADPPPGTFRAGAAAVDTTPTRLPVIVSGSFRERTANRVHDRLMSRALVLDDGRTRLAIAIVDTLMMPRELIDEAKRQASQTFTSPPPPESGRTPSKPNATLEPKHAFATTEEWMARKWKNQLVRL